MPIVRQRLKEAREDAGLSQEEVAKQLELGSHSAYGNYERGKADPDLDNLVKLSRILSKPITWFLGIENEDGKHLSSDEVELLEAYRGLTYKGKKSALGLVQHVLRQEAENT